jgi:hypothetical protein
MKLLFENWREYLNEASQTLESMPDDVFIEIVKNPPFSGYDNAYMINLIQGKERVGSSVVEKVDADDLRMPDEEAFDLEDRFSEEGRLEELDACDAEWRKFINLYTLHVEVDPHMKGYGPLLTDLAMELASKDDKWIISPNLVGGGASEDFKRVMEYYLNKRSDVTKERIDVKCWEYFTGDNIKDLDEVFKYLYTKRPTRLNSEIAKTKIIWKN